jgi:hypothetical protein
MIAFEWVCWSNRTKAIRAMLIDHNHKPKNVNIIPIRQPTNSDRLHICSIGTRERMAKSPNATDTQINPLVEMYRRKSGTGSDSGAFDTIAVT